jgi:hypothetical protein
MSLRPVNQIRKANSLLSMGKCALPNGTSSHQLSIVTTKYKEFSDEYMKLTEADHEREKK